MHAFFKHRNILTLTQLLLRISQSENHGSILLYNIIDVPKLRYDSLLEWTYPTLKLNWACGIEVIYTHFFTRKSVAYPSAWDFDQKFTSSLTAKPQISLLIQKMCMPIYKMKFDWRLNGQILINNSSQHPTSYHWFDNVIANWNKIKTIL